MRHSSQDCEKRLLALPNYDRFRCTPKEFICACGRRWVHVCDEAEGCFYALEGDESWFDDHLVHLPRLLSGEFVISRSEAQRCLAQGAVRLDGEVVRDLDVPQSQLRGRRLQLGRLREVQLP